MVTREIDNDLRDDEIRYEIPGLIDKVSQHTRVGFSLVTIDDRELIGIDKEKMRFYVDGSLLESIEGREGVTPELIDRIREFDERVFDDRMQVRDINDELDAIVQGLLNSGIIANNELSSYNSDDFIFLLMSDIESLDDVSVDYTRKQLPKDGPRDAYEHKKEMERIVEDMKRLETKRQQMTQDVNKLKSEVDSIYQRIRKLQAKVNKEMHTVTRGNESPDIEELERQAEYLDNLSKYLEKILKHNP